MTVDFVQEFLEEIDTPTPAPTFDSFTKVRLYVVYVAKIKEHTQHFNFHEMGKNAAYNAAVALLEEHGVPIVTANEEPKRANKWNPIMGVVFRRYRDDHIGREMNWKYETWEERYLKTDGPKIVNGEEVWYHWNWNAQSVSWAENTYDDKDRVIAIDTENSPLRGRWNTDLWAHVKSIVDATFDYKDESTWSDWNSYTNNEGKTYAQRYSILAAAFDTREELEEYMANMGVSVDSDGFSDMFGAIKITKKLSAWLGDVKMDEAAWYDPKTHEGLVVDVHGEIMKAGTSLANLREVQDIFDGIPMKTLKELAKISAF